MFLIASFISPHSINTLITKTNSSWLICELIKALEIKTSMILNLVVIAILFYDVFFFFFLKIGLYLFSEFIVRIFNPTVDLAMPIEIPFKKEINKTKWNKDK